MIALVDVGNTRIKWAQLVAERLTQQGIAVHRDAPDAAVAAFAAALPRGTKRFIVANVAGESIAARLRETAAGIGASLEFVSVTPDEFGVRCAYAEPQRLGVDRWLGVLAARRRAGGAVCVASAGTALTFDAVDGAGLHLGGLIVPGARLQAEVLDRNTSNIGSTAPSAAVPEGLELLGRTTATAVAHGAWLALAAAVDRAYTTVARALGTRPPLYLTGGDAPALASWLETPSELRADLVLEGLALFASARAGRGS